MSYSFNLRTLLADKILCYGLVGALICLVSPEQMVWACIFLFYPHHVHAYIGRHRVRPYRANEILRILALSVTLFWLSTVMDSGVYLVFCAVVFLAHNYVDDIRLCGETPDLFRLAATVPALAIVLGKQASYYYPHLAGWNGAIHAAAGSAALGLCVFYIFSRRRAGFYEMATLFFTALMCVLWASGIDLYPAYVFGGVIIAHGISWLFKTGCRRWSQGATAFRRYFLEAALLNMFFIGYYIYFAYHPQMQLTGTFVFSLNALATWGVVHTFSTIRWNDYRDLFSAHTLRRPVQAA